MKISATVAILSAVAFISRPCSSTLDLNPLTWFERGPIFGKVNLRKIGISFEDSDSAKISRGINGGA